MDKPNVNIIIGILIITSLAVLVVSYYFKDCRNILGFPTRCISVFCDCEKTCKNTSSEICRTPLSYCCKHPTCKNNKQCISYTDRNLK